MLITQVSSRILNHAKAPKAMGLEPRTIFDKNGHIPEGILADDEYFEDFKLKLSEKLPNAKNRFNGLNYATLGDYKTQFDLRPIRNIVVKQNSPSDDDSSIYEVFNRLNTGGVNLRPQEIRTSMYHSGFYDMLYRINQEPRWRKLLGDDEPDIHMKDIEVLLRGFAMLIEGRKYAPSLVRFLNQFSRKCETNSGQQNLYLEELFLSFLAVCEDLSDVAFINVRNNRFNMALFEAAFSAICKDAFDQRRKLVGKIDEAEIGALAEDADFIAASIEGTTRTSNVGIRMDRAEELLTAL